MRNGTLVYETADWIREMTMPRIVEPDFSYGYLWWLDHSSMDGNGLDWIIGNGWGGQCLYVIPKLALVVVVTAGLYDFDGKGGQNLACNVVMDAAVLPAALKR